MRQSRRCRASASLPAMSQFAALLLLYLLMVACNAAAVIKYDKAATDGYALSYVQPDGRTFGVWGIIYFLNFLLVVRANELYPATAQAVGLGYCLNGLWLLANGAAVVSGLSYWLAVWILVLYAGCLVWAYTSFEVDYMERPFNEKIMLFAPISANLSWVLLAALLNITNTLMDDRLDFTKHENRTRIGGPDWAIGVLGFACLLGIVVSVTRSDIVFPTITVWALLGVSRQQTAGSGFPHPMAATLKDFADQASIGLFAIAILSVCLRWLAWHLEARERPELKGAYMSVP